MVKKTTKPSTNNADIESTMKLVTAKHDNLKVNSHHRFMGTRHSPVKRDMQKMYRSLDIPHKNARLQSHSVA